VLHVEDDAFMAGAVIMTLSGEGWSVETCPSGAAALVKTPKQFPLRRADL